jgi:ribonuclease R
VTDAVVLQHIERLPHGRANFKQLLRELKIKADGRDELEAALERLAARGSLIEVRSGHFVAASQSREFAVGRLSVHRDGYAFLIADRPVAGVQGDVFLPPESASKAMHGDRVVVRVGHVGADGRADGEIVKVLARAHPTVVGEARVRRQGLFVVPQDARIQQWIQIPDGLELPPPRPHTDRIGVAPRRVESVEDLDGLIVNVELLEYAEKGESPVGRIIEILGAPGDFGIDVEIIIRKHHLPHEFPPEVADQARAISKALAPEEVAARRDFRKLEIVTIDGETARDFDDAVWVDRLPNGHYALQVHIADVSHYVRPSTPIDREASLRGTSVYFPDRAVPMLPFELSTDVCSLVPHEDRLVLSALLEIDRQGETVGQEFAAGVIASAERMTYTAVHGLISTCPSR